VTKILVEDGRVAGVQVKDQVYRSRYVVTNADLRRTYRDLVGPEHTPSRILDKLLNRWTPTCSCFSVWLGLDCEIEELGWSGENVTYYRTFDRLIEMASDLVRDDGLLPADVGCGINTASTLDPTMTPAGRSQVILGIPVASQFENNWGVDESGLRGQAYRETKLRIGHRLIDTAEQIMPNLRDHIKVMEVGTPLTYERYGRHQGGAYLGFALTPQSLMDKDHPTSVGYVKGLFHCSKSMGGGACATMQEAFAATDQILQADGRDDLWRFEQRFATPLFEKHQAVHA
jgi:phytoene dehydrogenase-like protein